MSRVVGGKSKRGDDSSDEFFSLLAQLKAAKAQKLDKGGSVWAKARATFTGEIQIITTNLNAEMTKALAAGSASLSATDAAVTAAAAKAAATSAAAGESFAGDASDIARLKGELSSALDRHRAALGAADQDAARTLDADVRRLSKAAKREFDTHVKALYSGLADKAQAASSYLRGPSLVDTV